MRTITLTLIVPTADRATNVIVPTLLRGNASYDAPASHPAIRAGYAQMGLCRGLTGLRIDMRQSLIPSGALLS